MATTKISSKGQVVLPKSLRDEMAWPVGTDLIVERDRNRLVLRRNLSVPETTVDQVAGMLKYDGPPVSIEDMQASIDRELRARWRRKSK